MTEPTPIQRTHLVEQLTGYICEHAEQSGAYFKALLRQGFTRKEALDLTAAMEHQWFHALYGQPRKDQGQG